MAGLTYTPTPEQREALDYLARTGTFPSEQAAFEQYAGNRLAQIARDTLDDRKRRIVDALEDATVPQIRQIEAILSR